MSQTEVARIRGRRATPSSLEKRRERHKANASFFAFRARGGWRGRAFRCRGRARSWPSRVDAPFRFRASGEHVPYGLVLFLRVEGRGRHDVTDRAKRRDARPEFSRVRSGPIRSPRVSRAGFGGVPARLLSRSSARLGAGLLASARTPCAVVLCGDRAFRGDDASAKVCRPNKFRGQIPMRHSLRISTRAHFAVFQDSLTYPLVHTFGIWMSKRNASSERNEHRGVGFSSRHSRRRRDR